jgi:hypothetical protein
MGTMELREGGVQRGRAFAQLAHCNMASAAHYMETTPMHSHYFVIW